MRPMIVIRLPFQSHIGLCVVALQAYTTVKNTHTSLLPLEFTGSVVMIVPVVPVLALCGQYLEKFELL